ncbi:MAG: DUF2892 domain-containing protein [Cyclobacteriaceae bacterium]
MKTNIGKTDRNIRILLAMSIAVIYYINGITGTWELILLVIIGILLSTSFLRVCPLYLPFGISTKKKME